MESSRQDSSIRSMPVQHRTGCADRGFSHKVQTDSLLLTIITTIIIIINIIISLLNYYHHECYHTISSLKLYDVTKPGPLLAPGYPLRHPVGTWAQSVGRTLHCGI